MKKHRLLLWILVLALAAGSLGASGCRTFGAPKTAFDVLRLTQSMTVSDVSHEAEESALWQEAKKQGL